MKTYITLAIISQRKNLLVLLQFLITRMCLIVTLGWLLDVLRSPLSDAHKAWFLARCQVEAFLIPPSVKDMQKEINSLLVRFHYIISGCYINMNF